MICFDINFILSIRNGNDGYSSYSEFRYIFDNYISYGSSDYFIINQDLLNYKKPFVYDSKFLEYVSEDLYVIDENNYEELRSLGNSHDKENHLMLMELLSNCNFNKSFLYILFILSEYANQFKSLDQYKHVNFQSLLKYIKIIDLTKLNQRNNPDIFVNTLIIHEQLNLQTLTRLGEFFVARDFDLIRSKYFVQRFEPVLPDNLNIKDDNI
jgi:hypothetical protein